MNLYLLSQRINNGYDTYDSCIVCAKDEEAAKRIPPASWVHIEESGLFTGGGVWAKNVSSVKCELIGTAHESQSEGVILASFNAG